MEEGAWTFPQIPKGFRLKAQGCEARVTLGKMPEKSPNPKGVATERTYAAIIIYGLRKEYIARQ